MLDDMDRQLINLLEHDALQSGDTLAKILNISATTVRRRLNNLIKNNVIRVVALADPEKVGYPVIVGLSFVVDPDKINTFAVKLADHPNIKSVAVVTGQFNVVALSAFRSTEELSTFIQTYISVVDGVKSVETHIFLQLWKGRYIHCG